MSVQLVSGAVVLPVSPFPATFPRRDTSQTFQGHDGGQDSVHVPWRFR